MSRKIKIILLIIIFLLVLSVAGAAGIMIFKMLTKAVPQEAKKSVVTYYTDQDELLQEAAEKRDASYCDQVELKNVNVKKDDCLYYIADSNNISTFCNLISDTDLNKKCLDLIASRRVVASNEPNRCLLLTVAEIRNDCLTTIFRQQNDLQYCQGFDQEIKILCEDIINTNMAFKAKDQKLCEKIKSETEKLNCISAIEALPKDSDNDGVLDYLERAYGTDPFNPNSK